MMENDPLIVQSHSKLLASAERVVVLADSRKLRQHSAMVVIPLGRIASVVTDWQALPEDLEPFRLAGIEIVVAPPEVYAASDAA